MDRWKAEMGRVRENRRVEERRSEKRKSQKKEDAGAPKGRKVAKHCDFPMICGSGGSKSRLAKAAGAEPSGQMRDEKLHAVVARKTFPSQNVHNTPGSDHSWKLRCRKSARHCGAKHISKSKCIKHVSVKPLLEVEMSKKCMPLWREAYFQVKMYKARQCWTTFGSCDVEKCMPLWREAYFEVKMYKAPQCRTTFGSWDVEKVHAVVARSTFSKSKCTKHTSVGPLLAVQSSDVEKVHAVVGRSTFRSQPVKNTRGSDHFWRFRCRFASLHYTTLHYTPRHYITLHYAPQHYNYNYRTTLHYTPLHYTPLH